MRIWVGGVCATGLLLAGCDETHHTPPVASDMSIAVDEDAMAGGRFAVIDADGDQFQIRILTEPAHGTLHYLRDNFDYAPNPNYNGPDSFTYLARDPLGRSEPATVSIDVRPVNDRPTATNVVAATLEDQPVVFTVPKSDIDGDATTLVFGGAVQSGIVEVLDAAAGTVRYTPEPNRNGEVSFFLEVHDASEFTTIRADVPIAPVNDAPVASNDLALTYHGNTVSAFVATNDTDIDGDALTIKSVGSTAAGQLTANYNTVIFTPNADFLGVATVPYVIQDPAGATSAATLTFEVRLINSLLFLADRDTPNQQELFHYDGVSLRKINLPLNANERILDFKTVGHGQLLYRTRENFTNHLYLKDIRSDLLDQPAVLISAHTVDGYGLAGQTIYYQSGAALYGVLPNGIAPLYAPTLPGEAVSGIVEGRSDLQDVFISTLQFNPALGASSLKRLTLLPPYDSYSPLVSLAAPDSVAQPLFTMNSTRVNPQPATPKLVYSAEVGGLRAIYMVDALTGAAGVRLSPQFGLNEAFSAVRGHPFNTGILYRGNFGSIASNIYHVSLSQPGVHTQLNLRDSAAQDLGAFVFTPISPQDDALLYSLSNAAGTDRRIYLTYRSSPGSGTPITPSTPGTFGAYELAVDPQVRRMVYLTATTAAGPSQLVLLTNPLQSSTSTTLRDAGTTLDQLQVAGSWTVAAVQERAAANSLLLVNLLAPGTITTIHAPLAGSQGVTDARFEQL